MKNLASTVSIYQMIVSALRDSGPSGFEGDLSNMSLGILQGVQLYLSKNTASTHTDKPNTFLIQEPFQALPCQHSQKHQRSSALFLSGLGSLKLNKEQFARD